MAGFIDWLASTFYTTQDQRDTAAQVAAAEQSQLDRQLTEGKRTVSEYQNLSSQVQDAGGAATDRALGKPGLSGLPALVLHYWWIWVPAGTLIWLFFFGGWAVVLGWIRKAVKK